MWSRRTWRRVSGLLAVIGSLGGLAKILEWAEKSQWLPTWGRVLLMLPWTPIVWLVLLALIMIGLSRVWALEERFEELTQKEVGDLKVQISDERTQWSNALAALESRLRAHIDERINRLGRSINDTLIEIQKDQRVHGTQLSELGQRLSRLERLPTAARERQTSEAREAHESESYPMADGTIWTRKGLDALPEEQRERLFEENPNLGKWWLGKPR